MDQPAARPTIRIMRPGTFRSVEGGEVTFDAAKLRAIAAAYDPKADPAPLVIGHPKVEDQAYGWVDRLEVEGDHLVAVPGDIDSAFADAVRAKKYPRVSASFYEPGNPHNPRPGEHYLKHVGFLGGRAPGVKGLGIVNFAAGDEAGAHLTIVTEQEPPVAHTSTTPKTAATDTASFAERETALATREAAIAQREQAAAKLAADARHEASVSFAEGLVKQGKLAPAGKALVVGLLDQLGEVEADATASFGEADADKLHPLAAFEKLLEGAGQIVSFAEQAGADKIIKPGAGTASFAAPVGYSVDPAQDAVYAEAKRLQAATPGLSIVAAAVQAKRSLAV